VTASQFLAAFLLEALRGSLRLDAVMYPDAKWYREVRHHYTELCWELRYVAGEWP